MRRYFNYCSIIPWFDFGLGEPWRPRTSDLDRAPGARDFAFAIPLATVTPKVTSVSPTSYPADTVNHVMKIFGSSFVSGDTLTFAPPEGGTIASSSGKLTFVSSTEIDYQFNDANDAGSWQVRVNSPDNSQHSSYFSFAVASAVVTPSITSVSPTSYPADTVNHVMKIFGSSFVSGDTLTFAPPEGGTIASSSGKLTFVSSSEIDYQFNDANDAGSWQVRVNSPDNSQHSSYFSFAVASAVVTPSITSVSPTSYPADTANHVMKIFGSSFVSGDTLTFAPPEGGTIASSSGKLTFVSSTEIDYQFNDANDAGSWQVRVNSPDNSQHSSYFSFAVASAVVTPSITSVSPTSYPADTANHVMKIFGSSFVSGDTLTFAPPEGGTIASSSGKLTFVSSSEIDYQFNDANDAGNWQVRVNSPDNSQHSSYFSFAVASQNTSYSLTPEATTVTEGNQVTFTITRSGGMPAETIFASTTQTEGYTNTKDYAGINGQAISFAAGQSTATITVQTINDVTPEADETFGLIVQRNSESPASTYLVKSTFTIHDDDAAQQPVYSVVASPSVVNENAGSITFTITRTGSLGADTVYASTLNGSANGYASNSGDYSTNVNNMAVSFAAGQVSKAISLAITDDGNPEADETFGLIVQHSPNDAPSVFLAKTNWTIHDDDVAASSGYSVSPSASRVGEAGSLFFTITRPAGLPAETLYASTTQDAGSRNEGDYATNVNNLAVNFAAGETVKTVDLALINDGKPEQDETFGFIIQHSKNDPISTYLARTTWTIDDDDSGAVTSYQVSPNAGVVASSAGTTITFTVTRSGDLPQETVYANTVAGSEGYSSNNGIFNSLLGIPIAFAAGETTSSTPVKVTMLGGVLDSISDYVLRLFKDVSDQVGIAMSTFSVKPISSSLPSPSNVPTIKLPFDFNQIQQTWVTQKFGEGDHGLVSAQFPADKYLFYALDFHAPEGTNVLAQGHGRVVEVRSTITEGAVGPSDHFGNYITVEYDRSGGHYYATYMHLMSVPDRFTRLSP